jgi:GH24 family phage-related lysozyme (muramidase)
MAQDKLTKIQEELKAEEGFMDVIYLDTLDKPTGGIGHLLSKDELSLYKIDRYEEKTINGIKRKVAVDKQGMPIKLTQQTTDDWFRKDVGTAMDAASQQAKELGIDSEDFEVALTSVNYQLGTGWKDKFPSAYKALQDGNYEEAIKQINTNSKGGDSAWKQQTPKRVENFGDAIMDLGKQQFMSDNEAGLLLAKRNASKIVARQFDIMNVMQNLGQVFEPFKKENK